MPALKEEIKTHKSDVVSKESAVVSKVKAKRSEVILFTSQLSVMLSSGVVLSEAVDAIAQQGKPGVFQDVLLDLTERIKSGDSFSIALAVYPRIFNSMFISMVEASEASGRMSEMLEVLNGYLSDEAETRKQIKSALVYPVIMLVMAALATTVLMFFVLPKFTKIYDSKGQSLPKITQMVVGLSQMMTDVPSVITGLSIIAAIAGGFYYFSRTPFGRGIIDLAIVRSPIIGTMITDTAVTRSMKIMATTINTGVNMLDAIEIMRNSCSNTCFKNLWQEISEKIQTGYQLSESIVHAANGNLVEPGIIQMIRAGEKSGTLGQVCEKISVFYEKKLKASIKTVTTLIEPSMIIVMGVIIGTIAIALMLPIFNISSVMAQ